MEMAFPSTSLSVTSRYIRLEFPVLVELTQDILIMEWWKAIRNFIKHAILMYCNAVNIFSEYRLGYF